MKTKNIYQGLALLAVALTTATCQNELNDAATQPQLGQKVSMTIRATQGITPQTRTSYEDQLGGTPIDGIIVKWEGGKDAGATVENIKLFGYTQDAYSDLGTLQSDPTSISDDGLSITFTGTAKVADEYLAIYPAENCTLDKEILFDFRNQKQDCTTGNEMAHLKTCDIMVGKPAETGTNNLEFTHKAIMLRFDLTLPTSETVTNVTLTNSIADGIWGKAFIDLTDKTNFPLQAYNDEGEPEEMSLEILNHTSSKALKAYMMIPTINLDDATLTITVTATGGKTFIGTLQTSAGTTLEAGKCYTLNPELKISEEISTPPVTAGGLGDILNEIKPAPGQTDLALTGTINAEDLTVLGNFLKVSGTSITTLDLSALTGVTEVVGFAGCANVQTVTLPTDATDIGDNAFNGCKALTTITQNEPEAQSRASISGRLKSVGKNAFKDCISMNEMFLHAKVTSIGDGAFEGCTNLQALIFEGAQKIGTGNGNIAIGTGNGNIAIGTGIVKNTHKDLKIFLPAIKDKADASAYQTLLLAPTHFDFAGYSAADAATKLNKESYSGHLGVSNDVEDLKPGGNWGK